MLAVIRFVNLCELSHFFKHFTTVKLPQTLAYMLYARWTGWTNFVGLHFFLRSHPGSITSQSRTKLKNAFLSLQVFKFSSLGSRTQRLLALGDKLVPGSGNSRFCKPTSVAVDRSGEFFVADGYVTYLKLLLLCFIVKYNFKPLHHVHYIQSKLDPVSRQCP